MRTIEMVNAEIDRINKEELEPIRIDRGSRYGAPDDTLANIAEFGWVGAAIHHNECTKRINNQVRRTMNGSLLEVADLENACLDAINYAFYILILLRANQPKKPALSESYF